MSIPIDFSASPLQALRLGFLKGMTAPFAIFAASEAPALPQIDPIKLPASFFLPEGPFGADWQRIGLDLTTAIARHESQAETTRDGQ